MSNLSQHVAGQILRREPVKTFETKSGPKQTQVIHLRVDTVYHDDQPVVMEYEQVLALQVRQDGFKYIPARDGGRVEVRFNVQGREWTSPQGEIKVFNTLDVWRIAPEQQAEAPQAQPRREVLPQVAELPLESDDLPF